MDTRTGELVPWDPQSDFQVEIPDHFLEQAKEVAAQGYKLWDSGHPYPLLRAWALAHMRGCSKEEITGSFPEPMDRCQLGSGERRHRKLDGSDHGSSGSSVLRAAMAASVGKNINYKMEQNNIKKKDKARRRKLQKMAKQSRKKNR